VCVQLRLYHLAVAAMEKCEALAELEGAAAAASNAAGAGVAFRVLKQLVHNWLVDTMQNSNRCAATAAASCAYHMASGQCHL
jgi:DNA polymerase epsilon subunit 1